MSHGLLPPLQVVFEVNLKRDQWESITDENVMKCIEEHKALPLFKKETPENSLRCHDLYFQTVEWQA